MDLIINVLCLLSGLFFVFFFSQRIKISNRFWASLGYALVFGEMYFAARVFHVSVALMRFHTVMSWNRSTNLLVQSLLGSVLAIAFYIKDGNRAKGSGSKQ
jgi:hypothetical protein